VTHASTLALSAAVLLGLAAAGCSKQQEAALPARPVLYTVVTPQTVATFGPFAGTVEPRYASQLGFQIGGRMVERDVDVGDLVKAGQRLAALDPKVPALALDKARADVADAKAQQTNAATTAQRQVVLLGEGAVAKARVDATTAAADTAQAKLNQAEAALDKARDQLGYTVLHADFDGVVTNWSAEIAQDVAAGQVVVTVARPEIKEAVVDIPDDLVARVHAGDAFTVVLQVDRTITAEAHVREIAPQSESATRSRRVRMTLQDPPQAMRLGTTITVALHSTVPPRVTLPATAIRDHDGVSSVWLVSMSGDRVTSRDVTLLDRAGAEVTVMAGLSADDKVVIAGVHSLSENQAVRLGRPL